MSNYTPTLVNIQPEHICEETVLIQWDDGTTSYECPCKLKVIEQPKETSIKPPNTCSIHSENSTWNGRAITCGGALDFNGNWLTCTCERTPTPPPPLRIEIRSLKQCHRVEHYKNPQDLPVDANCMCGECKPQTPQTRLATERSDNEGLTPMVHGMGLLSMTGGGSTNSLERTGACTPQCSCEILNEPCGDREEEPEEMFVPPKRTDSVIGLTIQGGLART